MLKEKTRSVAVSGIDAEQRVRKSSITVPDYDRDEVESIGWLTAMTLSLLGNYAQTGHFGGPLAYTPFVVTSHLLGPDHGGLRYWMGRRAAGVSVTTRSRPVAARAGVPPRAGNTAMTVWPGCGNCWATVRAGAIC